MRCLEEILFYEGYRTHSKLISIQAEFYGVVNNRGKIPGCENEKAIAVYLDGVWRVYFEKREIDQAKKIGLDFLCNEAAVERFLHEAQDVMDIYRNIADTYSESEVNVSEAYLFEAFKAYSNCLAYYRVTNKEYSENYDRYIKELLVDEDISEDEYQLLLVCDLDDTAIIEENRDWESIIQRKLEGDELDEALNQHNQKYSYLLGNVKNSYEVFKSKFRDIENYRINNNESLLLEREKIKNSLSEEHVNLIDRVNKLAKYRLLARENFMYCNSKLRPVYESILEKTKMNQKYDKDNSLLYLVSIEEYLAILKGEIVDFNLIGQRRDGMQYNLVSDNVQLISFGKNKINQFKENVKSYRKRDFLYGKSVYIGNNVKGRAVVIPKGESIHSIDLKKCDEGIILVVYSFHPDMLTTGCGISAIITVEGGILSHAAIIAREMRIPCITDVSDAIDIIKTNFLLEVNTKDGVVNILERAEMVNSRSIQLNGIYKISNCRKVDGYHIGNKAQTLCDLYKDYNILDGVCLSKEFCKRLLHWDVLIKKLESMVNIELMDDSDIYIIIGIVSEYMSAFKKSIELPKELLEVIADYNSIIVRSSGEDEDGSEVSFAGILESIENIKLNQLKNAICDVISSAFKLASLLYRRKNHFSIIPDCPAIILQPHIDCKFKGVLFTENPLTDSCEIVIEIENVSRQTINTIYISKNSDVRVQTDVPFRFQWIDELIQISERLVDQFHKELDIEWGISKDNDIILFQVRPITTL